MKRILIFNKKTKAFKLWENGEQAAVFMWGRDFLNWETFVLVDYTTSNVTEYGKILNRMLGLDIEQRDAEARQRMYDGSP